MPRGKKATAKPEPTPKAPEPPAFVDWRDPDAKFAKDDESLEARMWRLAQRTPNK